MQYKIILSTLFASSVMAAPIKSRATSHSNQLTFAYSTNTPGNEFSSVTFSSNQYSITGGQPWGGVSTSYGDDIQGAGSMVITVQAGRKDTIAPAHFFAANADIFLGDDAMSSGLPSELNFAFTGVLTLNGDSYNIVIGQGSNAEGNNWWIGA
jgi:hypothetical protein